jgi:hypothetical protein
LLKNIPQVLSRQTKKSFTNGLMGGTTKMKMIMCTSHTIDSTILPQSTYREKHNWRVKKLVTLAVWNSRRRRYWLYYLDPVDLYTTHMKVKVVHHWSHSICATWTQTHQSFPSVQQKLFKFITSASSIHFSSLYTPCCCLLFPYTTTPRGPPLYPFQASIYINCLLQRTCLATTTWFILHTHVK